MKDNQIRMKQFVALIAVMVAITGCRSVDNLQGSGTSFAKDALTPYVESGQLPGAINVFYKDGVQEIACVGYADVAAKRPITMNDVYMQCSQTKGFCGVTIAILVEEGKISLDDPVSEIPAGIQGTLGARVQQGRRKDPCQGKKHTYNPHGYESHRRFSV